jgi:hypothetical protein
MITAQFFGSRACPASSRLPEPESRAGSRDLRGMIAAVRILEKELTAETP